MSGSFQIPSILTFTLLFDAELSRYQPRRKVTHWIILDVRMGDYGALMERREVQSVTLKEKITRETKA